MGVFEEIGFLWHNGKVIAKDEFKLPLWTWTLHYGAGVFEGLRFYEGKDNSYIVRPKEHIARMINSAKIYLMKIPFTQEQIIQGMKDTIVANKQKGGYIRPIAYFGPMKELGLKPKKTPIWVGIFSIPFGRYLGEDALEKGIRCCVSSWTRHHPNIMPPQAKCNANYANSMLASKGAVLDGYAEAIMLDPYGYVSEGPGENIFLVKNGTIFTPPLSSSVLPGITRDCIMRIAKDQGFTLKEEVITRGRLYIADEIFFTGTAGEVTPITEIDNRTIGEGARGPVTKKLQQTYFNAVTGKDSKYKDWIMSVYD